MSRRSRIGRRELLRIGGITPSGLTLSHLTSGQTSGAEESSQNSQFGRAKNIIWLYMSGGPSQYETFDPKPEAGRTGENSRSLQTDRDKCPRHPDL